MLTKIVSHVQRSHMFYICVLFCFCFINTYLKTIRSTCIYKRILRQARIQAYAKFLRICVYSFRKCKICKTFKYAI